MIQSCEFSAVHSRAMSTDQVFLKHRESTTGSARLGCLATKGANATLASGLRAQGWSRLSLRGLLGESASAGAQGSEVMNSGIVMPWCSSGGLAL